MMNGRITYAYRILQYRHDPMAGELVNVGVMLHSMEAGFLDIRVRSTLGRLQRLYTDLDRATLTAALRSMEAATALAARDVVGLLGPTIDVEEVSRRITGMGDGCFVWGPVGSGLAVDLPATLERLHQRFVGKYDTSSPHHRSDDDVWRPVQRMLDERKISDKLEPKIITSPLETIEFRHSWKNGKYHCYQPMTFDYKKADSILDKVRNWTGISFFLKDAEEEFQPYLLLGAPRDNRLGKEYALARRMLEKSPLKPEIYEENDVEEFANRIEDSIRRHDGSRLQ